MDNFLFETLVGPVYTHIPQLSSYLLYKILGIKQLLELALNYLILKPSSAFLGFNSVILIYQLIIYYLIVKRVADVSL